MIKYRFSPNVSQRQVARIGLIDRVLNFLFGAPSSSLAKKPVKEITILQLAHIGDLVLLMPALKKLKIVTNYKINLVVSSQNYLIASKLSYVDKVMVADAPYFSRNKKVSYWDFIKQLRKINTGLIFDLRGDLRNIFFTWLFVKKKVFAGYDIGGGGALLDVVLPYPTGMHTTAVLDPLFDYLRVPQIHISACWHAKDLPVETVTDRMFPDDFLLVHLGVGAQSRKWSIANFTTTIISLSQSIPVYVMGTSMDISPQELAVLENTPNITLCVGRYTMLQSMYIVEKCSMFLGLDSGFSHIAALLKKKIFVLFSGSANSAVWKPYSFYKDQVVVINRKVHCDLDTGCGRLVCDNNICMKQIYPFEVISIIQSYLKKRLHPAKPIELMPIEI